MDKKALITGISGQDGSYLAELLLSKGYEVHGIIRRRPTEGQPRIAHLLGEPSLHLHQSDLTDAASLIDIVGRVRPDEIYNLAAQSHVHASFAQPLNTGEVDGLGALRVLEAVRILGLEEHTRVYQASTSELFGRVEEKPQSETTSFHPYSPYAIAKQYAFWMVREYREAYGMWCCSGILFNHESPRRGEEFVTRKITRAAGRIACGLQEELFLGNLDSMRDWGHARDYVECMWLMLQQDQPNDYVIATGEQHSVREFAERAFAEVGISLTWEGSGVDERGIDAASGRILVCVDPKLFRPTEVDDLLGDPSRAVANLGWNPTKTSFEELVREMAASDLALARNEAATHGDVVNTKDTGANGGAACI